MLLSLNLDLKISLFFLAFPKGEHMVRHMSRGVNGARVIEGLKFQAKKFGLYLSPGDNLWEVFFSPLKLFNKG